RASRQLRTPRAGNVIHPSHERRQKIMSALGHTVMKLLDEAARHSEPGPGVTRLFLTDQHRAIVATLRGWMQDAGMETRLDDAGTLVGSTHGAPDDAPVLILGSH